MQNNKQNNICRISLDDGSCEFKAKPGHNLLKAMINAGQKVIPVGCRGGGCGVCKIEIVSGSYATSKMSVRAIADNGLSRKVLACCIYPISDLIIKQVAAGPFRSIAVNTDL